MTKQNNMSPEIWAEIPSYDPCDECYQWHPKNLWKEGRAVAYIRKDLSPPVELIEELGEELRLIKQSQEKNITGEIAPGVPAYKALEAWNIADRALSKLDAWRAK